MDAVAILHADPLHPDKRSGLYYSDMRAENGTDSYVVKDFPLGVSGVPVKVRAAAGLSGHLGWQAILVQAGCI